MNSVKDGGINMLVYRIKFNGFLTTMLFPELPFSFGWLLTRHVSWNLLPALILNSMIKPRHYKRQFRHDWRHYCSVRPRGWPKK